MVGNKQALEAYLKQYPLGRYAALANAYLARLQSSSSNIPSLPITNPLSYDVSIPSSQKPSMPSSAVVVDCERMSENNIISSNKAKDNSNKSSNVVVTSSHLRPINPNTQAPVNCNRDK